MNGGTIIHAGDNMDDFAEIGNYYCTSASIAESLINAPFDRGFTLKVQTGTGSETGPIQQIYKKFNTGQIAFRMKAEGSEEWTDYRYFSDDVSLFNGTTIQSGDDMNDYTTPGIYRSTSSSITASLLNMPEIFGSGFAMIVFIMSSSTNVQVIFAGDKMYVRFSNTGGWLKWFKYSGTQISS